MSLKALLIAYIVGGLTLLPLLVVGAILFTIYTSVPFGDVDATKKQRGALEAESNEKNEDSSTAEKDQKGEDSNSDVGEVPKPRKGWLTMRRTYEEAPADGGYVTLVRSFLDARSKDPKRSRPRDMWFVVLKGTVLFLYEDEAMRECEAAIELGGHDVEIYPENLPDAELFAKRNAICLKPKVAEKEGMPSVTREMKLDRTTSTDAEVDKAHVRAKSKEKVKDALLDEKESARKEASDTNTPWFIFVRSNYEMEDWYLALLHASDNPSQTPLLAPLQPVFRASEMEQLVSALDAQPDVIPMRWLNALLGRIFYSFYRSDTLEASIITRIMRKLAKVKRPAVLESIEVTEVSVGSTTPLLSKPMLKELTREGDAALEMHVQYKGEIRITLEATATINLGARFKPYTVKLALAAVLKELEGNLLVKVKRPPSSRIWYAFTQMPRMVLSIEPIVSDRQITWTMILSTIESKLKEIIQESVVMPNMDDISFFDSEELLHRGGIWADAARKPKETRAPSESDEQSNSPESPTNANGLQEPPATQSEPVSAQADKPPPLQPAATISAPEEAISSSVAKENRRNTWFAGSKSTDGVTATALALDAVTEDSDERGRSLTADPPQATARSLSTESAPALKQPEATAPTPTLAERLERSVSRQSSGKDSTASSQEPSTSAAARSRAGSTATSEGGGGVLASSPSSTSSFLNTWKNRTNDPQVQALGVTAKETMRKWSAAWGGINKKDTPPTPTDSDAGLDRERERKDSTQSIGERARASYAEVRAAFDARRKAEESAGASSSSPSSSSSSLLASSTPKQRVTSGPSSMLDPSSAAGPSSMRTRAQSDTGTGTSLSTSPPDDPTSPPPPATPRAPVQVQPQAMTMQIPRIHASHRDEVQSMGYVAPKPSTPPTPARNSVYRLWRGPGAAAAGGEEESASAVESPSTSSPPSAAASTPAVASPKRGIPPPLPPRAAGGSISLSKPTMEAARVGGAAAMGSESLLKNIADKDDLRQQKRASVDLSTAAAEGQQSQPGQSQGNRAPPPLPPR